MKKLIFWISGGISFIGFLILLFLSVRLSHSPVEQLAAERWSAKGDAAQVSCFFSTNASITEDTIREFEFSLDGALQEASITSASENPTARLWADAYSADGRITLTSDKASVEADAIGIGGDFFIFHPLRLLSGSYFSGNDINQDYVVIDEDMAWQLFGSNDVDGMLVYIQGIPHIVTGVVKRPEGRLEKGAGLSSTVVYVSYKTLNELGNNNGINHFEIVMPNPVSNFAVNMVREQLGQDEQQVEILENSNRFSFLNELKVIAAFGTRSMNGKAIIYPYWENIARGYEDVIALMLVFMILLLMYPVILLVVLFAHWWKHKGWTVKSVFLKAKDRWERFLEKKRAERNIRKESKKSAKKEEGEFL